MSGARPIIAQAPLALSASPWSDYALLDSGGGRKLERYGSVTVVRPESQCLWPPRLDAAAWDAADAVFEATDDEEAGRWRLAGPRPGDLAACTGERRPLPGAADGIPPPRRLSRAGGELGVAGGAACAQEARAPRC